jgi:predicted amidohydrolase YtcJ
VGQRPLNIDERIPLTTAIDAYTINAAYAMKQDKTTGSREPGKSADLVILDRDILSIDPETIQDTYWRPISMDGSSIPPTKLRGGDQREARIRDWLHRD